MTRIFCKPAKRGSKAWELCLNSPCQCALLYEGSDNALRDAAPDMLEALEALVVRERCIADRANDPEILEAWQYQKAVNAIKKAKGEIDQ